MLQHLGNRQHHESTSLKKTESEKKWISEFLPNSTIKTQNFPHSKSSQENHQDRLPGLYVSRDGVLAASFARTKQRRWPSGEGAVSICTRNGVMKRGWKIPPKKTHETHEKWGFKGLLMIFMVKCLIKRMEVCSWEDHGTKWWIFRCHVWWPEGIPTKQLDARWGVALSFHSGVLTCCNGNVGRGRSPNRDTDTPEGPWTFQILHPPNPSGRGLSS